MSAVPFIEINLAHLKYNFSLIRKLCGLSVKIAAVVKDDAYGHGAVEVAKVLEKCGASFFAVHSMGEALELKESGISKPILIMGTVDPSDLPTIIHHQFHFTIYNPEIVHSIVAVSQQLKMRAIVHLKVDTGMHRLGIRLDEFDAFYKTHILPIAKDHLDIVGIMSHSPDANTNEASEQVAQFLRLKSDPQFSHISIFHIANSGTLYHHRNSHCDMVRPGISLYGYGFPNLKPVLSLKSKVASLKRVLKNETISYNRHYKAKAPMTVGVVPVGYANGYHRLYQGFGEVLVRGERTRICGDICMDMMMIDLTKIPNATIGNEVVLIGSQGTATITAEDIAKPSGFISYEVLTSLSPKLRKTYLCTDS